MEPQKPTDVPPRYARYQGFMTDGKRCVDVVARPEDLVGIGGMNFCPLMDAVEKVSSAIKADERDKFTWLLAEPILQENMASEKCNIGLEIIDEAAIGCASLVADGDTSDFGLDPDFGFDAGWTAVHQAALTIGDNKMLRFLLERDYSADVRADSEYRTLKQVLPLNVALHRLRSVWLYTFLASPNKSAPSLLKELYTMDMQLEVVRMLALKTREFKNEFFNYAKEGKMIEVGALLLAAGEKLLPISISEGEDEFNSFEEMSRFLRAKNNIDESAELKETVKLLDIYDKIGNQLSSYVALKENRRSGVEVAALLQDAGFDEKIDDHNNVQDYVNSSNISSFELKVPKMYSIWDSYLAYCKQILTPSGIRKSTTQNKMYLSNWMNKMVQRFPSRSKSQLPSMRTKQSTDTNMGAIHHFGTAATKVVNAMQKFNRSGKYGSLPWLKKFIPRR